MPYGVRKEGNNYVSYVKHSGKVLGKHKSKKDAEKQNIAVRISESKKGKK